MKEGLYKAFFSSWGGNSSAFFVIKNESIRGLDLGGLQYAGSYKKINNDNVIDVSIQVIRETAPASLSSDVLKRIILPNDFSDGNIHLLEAPIGEMSVSFEFCHEC